VGDVAAEWWRRSAHYAVPLDFLGGVEFVAAGDAAGWKWRSIDIF